MSEEDKKGGGPAQNNPQMDTKSGILTVEKPTGRRKCPKCGNENKLQIHESIDKENFYIIKKARDEPPHYSELSV